MTESATTLDAADRLATVRDYHQRTKHHFEAYAPGPGTLDWDAQPAPFRHFDGAVTVTLPPFAESLQHESLAALLRRPFAELDSVCTPYPPSLLAMSVLLQLSLGITAWKSYGPDRWAVRANPSSGNLHPTEAYLIVRGWEGLADGVYHYCPENHVLELRAELAGEAATRPALSVLLSSVMWREAWKYGERAFRYCQLDIGHAMAALRYAAAVLGWRAREVAGTTSELAALAGLDRLVDFPGRRVQYTELEEAETLLQFDFGSVVESSVPHARAWHGVASTVDAYPMYQWPVIDAVAAATRRDGTADSDVPLAAPALQLPSAVPVARVILKRRSAQRFDARHVMPMASFVALLQSLQARNQTPWDVFAHHDALQLVIFVHRVEGMIPGVYLLLRHAGDELLSYVERRYQPQRVAGLPADIDLRLLQPADAGGLHRAARALHCHQDIAADACLALGMLAPFDTPLQQDATNYRDLYRQAGLLGQVLYLSAEALGLNGTGIGCYFDDPVHELLGIEDTGMQSLYHFTIGKAIVDSRIETDTLHLQETI